MTILCARRATPGGGGPPPPGLLGRRFVARVVRGSAVVSWWRWCGRLPGRPGDWTGERAGTRPRTMIDDAMIKDSR
jgi:hypothetical protein